MVRVGWPDVRGASRSQSTEAGRPPAPAHGAANATATDAAGSDGTTAARTRTDAAAATGWSAAADADDDADVTVETATRTRCSIICVKRWLVGALLVSCGRINFAPIADGDARGDVSQPVD